MTKNKTTYTLEDVHSFVDSFFTNEQKKVESLELIDFFQDLTGQSAQMWGPSIIGFGIYHYTYESGHSGDAPILAFSPRKTAFSLYVYRETPKNKVLLHDLGKFKMGKSCIYVNKLKDIDKSVLKAIYQETMNDLQA